jgi:hypothetical protein
MLNDGEQHRLDEIEARLHTEDPKLVRALSRTYDSRFVRRRRVAVIGGAVAVVAVVVGLAVINVVMVVVALCATGVAAAVYFTPPHPRR